MQLNLKTETSNPGWHPSIKGTGITIKADEHVMNLFVDAKDIPTKSLEEWGEFIQYGFKKLGEKISYSKKK